MELESGMEKAAQVGFYDIFVHWQRRWLVFTFKTHVSHFITITLQHHNLPADCAREMFKHSKDAASILVSIFLIGKFWISCFLWVMS